nr:hypothetical protein [Tanacetum cinerariifolium]
MFKDKSYEAHKDHKKLYDVLEKLLERDYSDQRLSNLEEAHQKKRKRRDVPRTPSGCPSPQPPPPSPPAGASGAPCTSRASGSSQLPPSPPPPSTGTSRSSQQQSSKAPSSSKYICLIMKTLRMITYQQLIREKATALALTYVTSVENSLLAKTRDMTNFLNWEYLRHGSKRSSPTLSISKMKAASYPDFGLELLVPEQIHDSPSRRKEVTSHMRILSVVSIKAYSRYGYDYLSKIVLRIADLQEHMVAEKDFNNLHPSDFENLNLLLLQGHLRHLPSSDKRMLSTTVKLWTQNLVIR